MVCVVIVTAACASGVNRFREETNPENLFVPLGTQVRDDFLYVQENFPGYTRFQNVIFQAEDILVPEVIQAVSFLLFYTNLRYILYLRVIGERSATQMFLLAKDYLFCSFHV